VFTNNAQLTKVPKYFKYKKMVKYNIVVGLATWIVVFKFENKHKSWHSENDSEWCSVHYSVCRTYFKLKHLKEKNV